MKHELHPIEETLHLGETLVETIDHARNQAAQSLEDAASAVRATAARGVNAIDNLAEGTSERLDSTAKYVRNYHPLAALQGMMRRNPGGTLCLGIALGLLAGHSFRRG